MEKRPKRHRPNPDLPLTARKAKAGPAARGASACSPHRRKMEAALRESEDRYRTLFNAIDEAFCIIEIIFDEREIPVDYRFLEMNPAFEKQTGLVNAKGRRIRELVPKHEEHWFAIYGKIALTGQPERFQNRADQLQGWYDVYAFRYGKPEERQVAVLFNNVLERKRAEEALRESEKRFRTSVETMLDGFAIFSSIRDEAGRIVDFRYDYINEAGCRLNGRSREETLGRRYLELFPAIEASGLLKEYVRTVETGEPFVKEALVYSGAFAGGEPSTRVFNIRAAKMGDGLTVSWMDVTESRKADETVSWLASFPELNPNPLVEVDPEGAVRYVNPAGRRLFPGLEETGLPHPWLAGLEPILDRFRRGEDCHVSRVVTADGRHYHQSLKQVEGLRRIRIYAVDITERVAAEEASRRRAEELETLLESVPAVVWIAHDPECLHITGNRTADEFLRLIRGTEASLTAPTGERPMHFKLVKDGRVLRGDELPVQRAARGEAVADFEYGVEFTDGTVRHLVGNATPLFGARGKPRGSVSAFIDITERKRVEEALLATLEEKDDLLRELSHRTKNNMQVIVGLLGLQAVESGDERLTETLANAQDRIRAMALVHEKLYRSGSVSTLGMKEYVKDLVTSLLRAHQGSDGPVRPVLELEEIFVSLDAALPCGLIINELVSNSLKHAFPDRKAGSIFLSLRQPEEELELRYRDDGPGLPEGLDLSRVGSLGLKLVYNLVVRQLRGTMELAHKPVTEFTFRFRDVDIMKKRR